MEQEEIFAVIGFVNREQIEFPVEINDHLKNGYMVKSIKITQQSTGSNAIAFLVLTK